MMEFQVPDDLDPETTLICTSCRTEYTSRYQATVCSDCGGSLMALDGTLLEPTELAYCKDCARPFEGGSGPFCGECSARRLGLTDVSSEERDRFYPEGAGSGAASASGYGQQIMRPFDTDNPYMNRLFAHELFGRVPEGCRDVLSELSTAHPDELLVTAMRVRHGQGEGGFLMVTTHFLRYVKAGRVVTFLKKDELWPLDVGIEAEGMLGPGVIRTESGHQFQIWGVKAKKFVEFVRLAQLALSWDANEDASDRQMLHDAAAMATVTTASAPGGGGGLAAELAELARLRDAGVLSDEEFAAAKRKLLDF